MDMARILGCQVSWHRCIMPGGPQNLLPNCQPGQPLLLQPPPAPAFWPAGRRRGWAVSRHPPGKSRWGTCWPPVSRRGGNCQHEDVSANRGGASRGTLNPPGRGRYLASA